MLIEPNSTIKIYHRVPLDNSYQNTLYFESKGKQNEYFHSIEGSGIAKYTLTNQSYQRVVKGSMRVQVKADDLYDCNYLAFQNTNFGNKWFYAFITSVEYVNNVTSEITFEIDVMQTYMFDVTIKPSFIEREHSETDELNDWLVPENLETGEYVINNKFDFPFGSPRIVLKTQYYFYPTESDWEIYSGSYSPNTSMFSGMHFYDEPADSSGGTNIAQLIEKINSIEGASPLSVEMLPEGCIPSRVSYYNRNISIPRPTSIKGYTPMNKKLFTYPYTFILADDKMGKTGVYNFEYFTQGDLSTPSTSAYFQFNGTYDPLAVVWTYPENYKGVINNYEEAITTTGFPTCSFNNDTYVQWVAQNKNTLNLQALTSAVRLAAGIGEFATGNPLYIDDAYRNTQRGASGIVSLLATMKDKQVGSVQSSGRQSGDSFLLKHDFIGITFYVKTVTETMAKIIDKYFSMFGYASHTVKTPNRHARKHYTYTKTQNCCVVNGYTNTLGETTGGAPADDLKKIASIYNTGITFWVTPSEVGNYSDSIMQDNTPLTT